MARTSYTAEQRARALELYRTHGAAEAERLTGIKSGTIRSWASKGGVATERREELEAGVATASLTMEARRQALASGLMDDIEHLRSQLFAPTATNQAMVVSDGAREGSHVEVIEVKQAEPGFRDKQAAITSIAIAVDKVQLLTGAATSRTEHTAGKEAAHAVADELAARRKRAA